jgi:hypothetical protein
MNRDEMKAHCAGFKLGERIKIDGRQEGVVVGKCYGSSLDMWAGRLYDVRIERGTWVGIERGLEERRLERCGSHLPMGEVAVGGDGVVDIVKWEMPLGITGLVLVK